MPDINQSLDLLLDLDTPVETKLEMVDEVGKDIVEATDSATKKAKDLKKRSKYSIEDSDFLREELKHSILSIDMMMEIMSRDLKTGTKSRDFECYAALVKSKTEAIKELRELNDNEQKLIIKEDEMKSGHAKMMLPFGGQFNQQNILQVMNGTAGAGTLPAAFSNQDTLRKQLIAMRENAELAEVTDNYEFEDRAQS